MKHRPKAVAFDVIGTLFDISPLEERLEQIGLRSCALQIWFAHALRDAFALEVSGVFRPFREVASGALAALMKEHEISPDKKQIEEVLAAFTELPAYPDVAPAMQQLRAAGIRIATLTNGSEKTTRAMLKHAGLDVEVRDCISIDDVKHWKPAPEVYLHAATVLGFAPAEVVLIAAHDWDTHGAQQAGLMSAGILRKPFSSAFAAPNWTGTSLVEVVETIINTEENK